MPFLSAKRHSGVPSWATTTRAGCTSYNGSGQHLSASHSAAHNKSYTAPGLEF
ncbi:hypothetical protein BN128_2044 [Cronobacter sakazakii 696]|nr:hypothetical protein BN128_2044 [Cronobacter sakazakii 696]